MSDTSELLTPVRASTRRSRRIPVIWTIPLLAIAIGGWLAWDTLSKRGPTITISFVSAEGLQAGQSQLKFKDIVLGTVQSLTLTPDHSHVLVKVATTRQAEPLLTEQTIFWVVKPRLFAGNVSGLDTLLSGSYIGMLPPQTEGKRQLEFTGREDPPILEANVPGTTFLLQASRIGSISLGSPVFYRDISVGEVLGWDIGDMAASVTIRAFVRAPFDKYVQRSIAILERLGCVGEAWSRGCRTAVGIAARDPAWRHRVRYARGGSRPLPPAASPGTSFPCSRIATRRRPPRTAERFPWYPISPGRFADLRQDPRSRCTALWSAT